MLLQGECENASPAARDSSTSYNELDRMAPHKTVIIVQ